MPTTRRRCVAVVAVALVVLLAGCMSGDQSRLHTELNADRRAHGRAALPTHDALNHKAQKWAERLAWIGHLEHSRLPDGVPSCWRGLAENVGFASSVAKAQDVLMASSAHRTNILGSWSYVGVGVARRGSTVFVVQVFMRGC